MMNGEMSGCLDLLIVCINCIKIDFSDTAGVSMVWELKI